MEPTQLLFQLSQEIKNFREGDKGILYFDDAGDLFKMFQKAENIAHTATRLRAAMGEAYHTAMKAEEEEEG